MEKLESQFPYQCSGFYELVLRVLIPLVLCGRVCHNINMYNNILISTIMSRFHDIVYTYLKLCTQSSMWFLVYFIET